MARMHARVRGKSGSRRPVTADLSFVKFEEKEVIDVIIKLAKDEVAQSMIGLILRDTYGVPSVKKLTGKSISTILKDSKVDVGVPEDLSALVVKVKSLEKHLKNNTRDVHNRRGLLFVESKIRRLSKYYKKVGSIPANWSY